MNGDRIDLVLFDLGGVFLDWDPRYLYRKLFGEDVAAMEDFLANVCTPAWHSEQDRGQSIAEACAERRAKFPQYAELIDAWGERSEEMINGVIDGSVQIFADIKQAGVPCYALSNMERENWERRYETYDFLRWFDGYFISGLEGVIKPDPEYFELALERACRHPDVGRQLVANGLGCTDEASHGVGERARAVLIDHEGKQLAARR